MRCRRALLFVAVTGMLPAAAASQTNTNPAPSPLVQELERCRRIQDAAKRVACYDAASGALVRATNTGQVSVVDRQELRRTRRSLFGFSMPRVPWFTGDQSAEDESDKLESTIKSVEERNGRFRIVLVDNAVWETTENRINYYYPQPGQKITILRGPLGSYFLQINGQIGLRGRRVG